MKKIFIILFIVILPFFKIDSLTAKEELIKTETKNKIIFVKDKDGSFSYSWSFNKDNYSSDDFLFNMNIKNNTFNQDEIEKIIDKDIKKEYISFDYHGKLPSVATIKIKTDKFKDGQRLNLYYYNEDTNKIEKISNNILVKNGFVSFDISHCSDYFLTLSIVNNAEHEKNNYGVVIIGMMCVIIALIGYTIFKNKNQ